jgi:hypothetical protein
LLRTEPSPYLSLLKEEAKDSRSKQVVTYSNFENHASTRENEAIGLH